MTTYAVIGSGAIGGYYGAQLARAGSEVHFMYRRDAEVVRERGLTIESDDGDFTIQPVNTHAVWHTIPPVDVALVAVKEHANEEVAAQVGGILKDDGAVLLIQNGLGGEAVFADALGGSHPVLGGVATIACQRTGPATVTHFAFGAITIGQYAEDYEAVAVTPVMDRVGADLTAAGLPVHLSDDLLLARWMKLAWNVPFNSLSVVLGATTEEMMTDPAAGELVMTLMREVAAAAQADGREVSEEYLTTLFEMTRHLPPYSTSMKVDFDAGRPMEVEGILGDPLRRARASGAAMPVTEAVYRQLRFINARLGGEELS